MNSQKVESTGIKSLDHILDGLRAGDNVVWNVDNIDDYRFFASNFVENARKTGKRVVYMRFGRHEKLIQSNDYVKTYKLDALHGFELFTTKIFGIIQNEGKGAFYVFDCLSDLLMAWATDTMISNFFQVTCPYLCELDTIAYFPFIRGSLSFETITRIKDTTQLLLNVYNNRNIIYIHPFKVWKRDSPLMFLPHLKRNDQFIPVANSFDATNILSKFYKKGPGRPQAPLDYWDRLFIKAEEMLNQSDNKKDISGMIDKLTRILMGRDERILSLARKYFSLDDLLDIKARIIGTGYIGGKAVGMLLARNILLSDDTYDWQRNMERHDSFFVGSDVFYSYIVHNGWWKLYTAQKISKDYFKAAKDLRAKMLKGEFPLEIKEKFQRMLEYFGQYPIIVRSSSLLEDSFGNAFAGKYESHFCVNQADPEKRYSEFENSVRRIFASVLSEDALAYRIQRNLDKKEEQMALLIQRVSGSYHDHYYFPELAGVGLSFNAYMWSAILNPKAGMLRLVLGLGTRAVERIEDDYARIIALDAPLSGPQAGKENSINFSQKKVDLLNLRDNSFQTISLKEMVNKNIYDKLDHYGIEEYNTFVNKKGEKPRKEKTPVLTFNNLLSNKKFINLMQRLLQNLEKAYQYPVDVEFTVNHSMDNTIKINPVQCRPMQTRGQSINNKIPEIIDNKKIFFRSEANFMGGSTSQYIKKIIWVDPERYNFLTNDLKKETARLVGRINKSIKDKKNIPTMFMGPGRWGTSTPNMGVPVTFSEINNSIALVEIAFKNDALMPELSFGSHFFQDLVETEIFYVALFPNEDKCRLNKNWMDRFPNILERYSPQDQELYKVIKIIDLPNKGVLLMSDIVSQEVVCYLDE